MKQVQLQKEKSLANKRPIILDSCIYVEDKKCSGRILTTLSSKLRQNKLQLVLPRIVIYEVAKVTKNQQQLVIQKIIKSFKKITQVEKTNSVELESKRLETKYYECYRSDSVILATAKAVDAVLVTYDQKLLRTALLEDVRAYTPKEFLRHWSVAS